METRKSIRFIYELAGITIDEKMAKRLNVALVGCGRIMPAHLWGYRELQERNAVEVRIKAIVARRILDAMRFRRRGEGPPPRPPVGPPGDPLRAPHIWVEDFQKDIEVELYDDYQEMLKNADIDAVDICTSVFSHHTIALDSIAAGKHVMLEKPMAVTVKACRKIAEAARNKNLKAAVAEVVRFHVRTRMAKWAIDNGYIGEPRMIIQQGIHAGRRPSPPPSVLPKPPAEIPWRQSKILGGGGVFFDLGVHHFDTIRYLCGEIDEMSGLIKTVEPSRFLREQSGEAAREVHPIVDDTYFCHFTLENGAIGILSFSAGVYGESTSTEGGLIVYGSKGCLKGDHIITDAGERELLSHLFRYEAPKSVKEKYFPFEITDWFALETLDWLRAISEERDPEVSGLEGLKDVAVAMAIAESSELKRTVKVKDVEEGLIESYQKEINEYYGL